MHTIQVRREKGEWCGVYGKKECGSGKFCSEFFTCGDSYGCVSFGTGIFNLPDGIAGKGECIFVGGDLCVCESDRRGAVGKTGGT